MNSLTVQPSADRDVRGCVATFRRGAWTAHVVDMRERGFTECHESRRYRVRLDLPGGVRTDWPIRYSEPGERPARYGTQSLDRLPRDARRAVDAAFRFVDSGT